MTLLAFAFQLLCLSDSDVQVFMAVLEVLDLQILNMEIKEKVKINKVYL